MTTLVNATTTTITKYYIFNGQRIAMRKNGALTYLHGDHLGSASLATTAIGAQLSAQRYLPYGGTRDGAMPTDRQYTGQRHETSLGFYDYNARQYDPVLGRFLQADSIVPAPGNPQSLNRYSYTYNNPLKYVDSSGHTPLLVTAAVGASIGAIVSIGYQTIPLLVQGATVAEAIETVSWAEVAGAAAAGGVMGLTLGVGTALGAAGLVGGTSLGATAVAGAVGGGVGGQVGIYVESATEELLQHDTWNSERVLANARQRGLGDARTFTIDAGAGAFSAVAGRGVTQIFEGVGLIPTTPQGFASPSQTVRFDIRGNAGLISDSIIKSSPRVLISSGAWTLLGGVGEEVLQNETKYRFEALVQ